MDEKLHQIVQGRTPLVWEGVVPPAHVELLLALGWALDGSPRQWSRRHWSVGLRGERGYDWRGLGLLSDRDDQGAAPVRGWEVSS